MILLAMWGRLVLLLLLCTTNIGGRNLRNRRQIFNQTELELTENVARNEEAELPESDSTKNDTNETSADIFKQETSIRIDEHDLTPNEVTETAAIKTQGSPIEDEFRESTYTTQANSLKEDETKAVCDKGCNIPDEPAGRTESAKLAKEENVFKGMYLENDPLDDLLPDENDIKNGLQKSDYKSNRRKMKIIKKLEKHVSNIDPIFRSLIDENYDDYMASIQNEEASTIRAETLDKLVQTSSNVLKPNSVGTFYSGKILTEEMLHTEQNKSLLEILSAIYKSVTGILAKIKG